MSDCDAVYADRNHAVQLAAAMALRAGFIAGVAIDPSEGPEWPVLYIDTPEGQVSWHIPFRELTPGFARYLAGWDGHDDNEKAHRIEKTVTATLVASQGCPADVTPPQPQP